MRKENRHLTIVVNQREYAIPINHIREVVDTFELVKVVENPGVVIGYSEMRDQAIPVLNPYHFLKFTEELIKTPESALVILEEKTSQKVIGIFVDEVIGVQFYKDDMILDYDGREKLDLFESIITKVDKKMVLVLDSIKIGQLIAA